ncbi:hypothetical protein KM043_007497 [Ampulex compressa]|nr:hypothetical protein KM043_007497 [Ampulex compressa]
MSKAVRGRTASSSASSNLGDAQELSRSPEAATALRELRGATGRWRKDGHLLPEFLPGLSQRQRLAGQTTRVVHLPVKPTIPWIGEEPRKRSESKMKGPAALLLTACLVGSAIADPRSINLNATTSDDPDTSRLNNLKSIENVQNSRTTVDTSRTTSKQNFTTAEPMGDASTTPSTTTAGIVSSTTTSEPKFQATSPPKKAYSKSKLDDPLFDRFAKPLLNPKDILLQEIRSLDEEVSNSKDEVAETLKAESKRFRVNLGVTSTARPVSKVNATQDRAMKKLLEDEDMPYEDELGDDGDEDEEDEDEYDDGEDEDDELDNDEEVMTRCPDYCRCSGQYAAATTAKCSKLVDEQSFGTGIAHLRMENAAEIQLGPHALRSRGLQQLESVSISDTKIVELDRTAFDGITYLFAVNLTRNGLADINPYTFQNNTQLSLLTISGNPLKHIQESKLNKHFLLYAPSVTEFDFSNNGIARLKRSAFTKMSSLAYVNLRGNRLTEIDSALFAPLTSLVEVDLSYNLLNELPTDLFLDKPVQTLRVAGNNLSTLTIIRAPKLTILDASNNRIKIITKDDLSALPLLDQLTIRSNGLKRIHQHAFAELEQLTYLDISDNKLTSFTEHHLRTNSRLQVLRMNDNPGLETLPVFKTTGVEYETFSVYQMECANCGLDYLQEGTFNAMPALTHLNLARNRLTRLPNGLLDPLSSLRELDLSNNIIGSLDSEMLRGATSLKKLSLAGNPLVTLQVTPFLKTPELTRLDVSRCALERVWSEARVPLKSLRFLSVRGNLLRRITVEELRATPKLSGLDLSLNPLDCDDEFNTAIQWLIDHGVAPTETLKHIANYKMGEDYPESDGIGQWIDLAKVVCDGVSDGPPPRTMVHKDKKPKVTVGPMDVDDSDSLLKKDLDDDAELLKLALDHGIKQTEEVENAWTTHDQEYEDFGTGESVEYAPWYSGALWPILAVMIVILLVLLLAAQLAVCLAKRRGRGPVIRPPMILRQGLIDNKNCGLVYKPLQEEIPTPHMPKRGSFYSSSTFHYDKIVPESV